MFPGRDSAAWRVSRLPAATERLRACASVIGRVFAVDVFGDATDSVPVDVLEALDAALETGIITESDRPGYFECSRALVADALRSNSTLPAGLESMHESRRPSRGVAPPGSMTPRRTRLLARPWTLTSSGYSFAAAVTVGSSVSSRNSSGSLVRLVRDAAPCRHR